MKGERPQSDPATRGDDAWNIASRKLTLEQNALSAKDVSNSSERGKGPGKI